MLDFSLYSEIAKWVGWPAVSAILILVIAMSIFLYNQQIKILKEENNRQQKEIEDIKNYSADQLVYRLKERHKLAMEELDNFIHERNLTEEKIFLKEKELENLKSEKNFSEKSNKDKIEKLESQIKIFKNEYELAKKLAVNKQIELEAVISQAKFVTEDLKKRLSEKNS